METPVAARHERFPTSALAEHKTRKTLRNCGLSLLEKSLSGEKFASCEPCFGGYTSTSFDRAIIR
jgi:hypothetical protein